LPRVNRLFQHHFHAKKGFGTKGAKAFLLALEVVNVTDAKAFAVEILVVLAAKFFIHGAQRGVQIIELLFGTAQGQGVVL
jgi:hypothetical protein